MSKITPVVAMITCILATTVSAQQSSYESIDEAYIAGFLAGAQLSDREIISRFNVSDGSDEPSDFLKRAFKTRLGEPQPTVPDTYYAGFCIPEDQSQKTVINAIIKEIKTRQTTTETEKANSVFLAVQTLYPCQK